jgi:molecular chaperone DnaJ
VPHQTFGRDGTNLTVRVPVSFPELALGGTIEVPTLDGSTVTLRLRPGTPSGSRHRVKGKGVVTTKSHGDLIVTVDVIVPTTLNEQQRAAIEAFAAATPSGARAHAHAASQPTTEQSPSSEPTGV